MRGVAIDRFGGPEELAVRDDLPEPPVGPDTVLVRVHAAGVNPVDYKICRGGMAAAYPHHFPLIPGWDLAGVVERVGPAVTAFAPGDEVIGYVRRDDVQFGTYADLVPAPPRCLAPKPSGLSMVEAAGLPLAGLTGYQALHEALGVSAGERVLVHAAGGGVGSMAVQLAKAAGAVVVGTASAASRNWLVELGVDEPLDYAAGPVSAQLAEPVDAVLDLVGGDALADAPRQLRGEDANRIVSIVDASTVLSLGGRYVFVRPEQAHLTALAAYVEKGVLRVPVAAVYPLEEAAEAHRRLADGHVHGKLVLDLTAR